MSKQLKAMLYFYVTDMRKQFTIFWMILMSIVVVSLIMATTMPDFWEAYLTISIPVYTFSGVAGFKIIKESLPFTIKMGGTRSSYFVSIGMFMLGYSIIAAFITNVVHSLSMLVMDILKLDNLQIMHPTALMGQEDVWLYRFGIDFYLNFFFIATLFILGLIFYKFGIVGGFLTLGVFALLNAVAIASGELIELGEVVIFQSEVSHYLVLFGIGAFLYVISWSLLRRISAVPQS
ncbi:hypothetical protein KO561_03405 [Radiobacillus kanasensis]|uniref:hypothetical protein n=1 Tax=Radiobacillus kanasensis TaxID=2844358 RepID=UPI001E2BAA0F|nr:hypothetical protein [Radiobacillus kanasensis]UFU00025.1 hypothetical protein KO561_03405 [Radiobacillus kanasensis]